jgi:hypothetical protein
MTNTPTYLAILAVSFALTMGIGRILYGSGEPFLTEVFGDEKVAGSVNKLLAVLFQLLTLGVVSLVSIADFGGRGTAQTAVIQIGVTLLVLGGAHGLAMRVLLHARTRRRPGQPVPPPGAAQAMYGYGAPCGPAPYPPAAYPPAG